MTIRDRETKSTAPSARDGAELATVRALARRRADDGLPVLVAELGDRGFSWRDVARIAGASPRVLHQGCQGAPDNGVDAERVAMLVALCEVACCEYRIDDVAGWLESPVSPEAPVTAMDLVARGRWDLVLRLARSGGDDAEAVMDEFEPCWRERYASGVEAFVAPDGLPGLRLVHEESRRGGLLGGASSKVGVG